MAAPDALNSSSDPSDPGRRVERQPAGLVRVRLDGMLLACNDAALGLFGAGARPQVLNTDLTDRIVPVQRAQWQQFVTRCWSEGAASFECDLLGSDSTARRVIVQGVALTQHPDGFDSLLLHLGDPPQPHPLAQPTQHAGDQHKEATFAALEKKLEHSQLTALQQQREYGRDVAMLKAALAAAHAARAAAIAEQARLQAVTLEHEAERERIAADHRVAIDALRQSLVDAVAEQSRIAARAEEPTRELDLLRAEHQRSLAHLKTATEVVADYRRQLSEGSAEQRRLAARIEEHERERDALVDAHQRALADLESRGHEALTQLRAEQAQLRARVAEYEADRTRTAVDHQAAVGALEQSLAQTLAEHRRITARAEARERDLDVLRAEHARTQEQLIAAHSQALEDVEAGTRETIDQLRSQLAESLAEQRRLSARLEEHERERAALIAEHHRALADVATEHTRVLAARVEQHERERLRIGAEHDLAIADLQARQETATAGLRSELLAALTEQQRLTALVEEQDRERERIAAEHRRAIADLQASKQEAVAECERVMTEVQQALLVKDASRRLEVERRLVDGIVESPQMEVDGQRLAFLQRGLTQAVSRMHSVITDEPAKKAPAEAEPGADLLREPFDDADDAFVHQLLGGGGGTRHAEAHSGSEPVAPAKAASALPAVTAGDESADAVFDAQDAAFASRLMSTHRAPDESEGAGAQPPEKDAKAQPAISEES